MIKRAKGAPWSVEDIALIKAMRGSGSKNAEIAQAVGRTEKSVYEKFFKMELGQKLPTEPCRPWSAQELKQLVFLRDKEFRSWGEIAKIMGRPSGTVYSKHSYLKNMTRTVGRSEGASSFVIPERIKEDWRRRQSLNHRDLTSALCGDPLPGYSALERRT